mmetsp:Transcript_40597/g.114871  ORF Transcript_40597/g.114871 Transcript_40597/m.114871 type:complete len:159 (-) Transcript_40597:233-709(-)
MVSDVARWAGKLVVLAAVCFCVHSYLAAQQEAKEVSCGLMTLRGELTCDGVEGPCDVNREECKLLKAKAKALCPGDNLFEEFKCMGLKIREFATRKKIKVDPTKSGSASIAGLLRADGPMAFAGVAMCAVASAALVVVRSRRRRAAARTLDSPILELA